MIRKIITKENPILRKKANVISKDEIKTKNFQKLINDMVETMYSADGIGLAAPQIGISKRLIIVDTDTEKHVPVAIINPEIVSKSWRTVLSEEGCLSVPGFHGVVKRVKTIKIKGLDRNGETLSIKDNKLTAIILQHEIDHLNGILFIDKAIKLYEITNHTHPRI